jgi:DNA-directed RNA polymerase subunit RPC12/RpoP
MSEFKFSCPNCDQHLQCDDAQAGTELACPTCEQMLVVPFRPAVPRGALRTDSTKANRKEKRAPSRLRGLAGALVAALIGGGIIGGISVLIGLIFPFLWFGMAWAVGNTSKKWGANTDQLNGLFSFLATALGMAVSFEVVDLASLQVSFIFGGLGFLVSLIGSLWLAFRTGSTD